MWWHRIGLALPRGDIDRSVARSHSYHGLAHSQLLVLDGVVLNDRGRDLKGGLRKVSGARPP